MYLVIVIWDPRLGSIPNIKPLLLLVTEKTVMKIFVSNGRTDGLTAKTKYPFFFEEGV